jgi:hypothetical protein
MEAPPLIGTACTFHAVSILAERGVGLLAAGGVLVVVAAAALAVAARRPDRA